MEHYKSIIESKTFYLHLLTDKHFYVYYEDIFSEEFYHDYNKLNRGLIENYNIVCFQ